MKIDLQAAGQRIRQIRKQHKYSMAAMAKLVGTSSASTVNNWEKGNNLPNKERLEKIAILGNTTVEWLIYGDFETYVYHLLEDSIAPDKLQNPEFMEMLLLILKREHISYNDDLQILTMAQKLYVADPTAMNDYFEQPLPETVFVLEDTPLYKIEKNSTYRQQLLPQLENLLTAHADADTHVAILTTLLHLLKQPFMQPQEKQQLLVLLSKLNDLDEKDQPNKIAATLLEQLVTLVNQKLEA
jgi:transcriptional regulator with XRE-family HTH domain